MATRTEYRKLVRDGIPALIEQRGGRCAVTLLGEEEYRRARLMRLVEEAQEVASGEGGDLVTELADLYELIDAILAVNRIDQRTILAEQARRRAERGGFTERLMLVWSE